MIKAAKLRWGGHLQRMGNNEISSRIVDSKLEWCKRVGRTKLQWIDGVVEVRGSWVSRDGGWSPGIEIRGTGTGNRG